MTAGREFPRHPHLVPEPLRWIYVRTEVRVRDRDTWLGPPALLDRHAGPVFVVTACNPNGEPADDEENGRRMTELRADLETDRLTWLEAEGRDPAGDWVEPSFAILDTDLRTARALGRAYEQLAIFQLTEDEQVVHGCHHRWSRSRRHDEPIPIGEGDTLAEAVECAFGVGIERDLKRFRHRGWTHLGRTELGCGECGDEQQLFGVVRAQRDGAIVEHLSVICTACRTATMTDELDPGRRQMVERWRDHLLARRDGDQTGGSEEVRCYVIQLGERDDRWVYVGQTATDPADRLDQHKAGVKANPAVRDHGIALRDDLMAHLPTFPTRIAAESYERCLGAKLALAGYRVEGAH